MATLGHIAVGLAAGRLYHRPGETPGPMLAWGGAYAFLAALPDADLVGFVLGVDYAAPWGHRGATHSLAFAIGLGVLLGVGARWLRLPALRTGIACMLAIASHPILDSFTNGGLGCAFLWPFDTTRYFAPWNPIPFAPTGQPLLSHAWLRVLITESVLFAPLIAFALWPRTHDRSQSPE